LIAPQANSQQLPQEQPAQGATKPQPNSDDPFLMDLESLSSIKVTTASKFSEKLSDAPSVMSVITSDELRRFGGMSLREVLEQVAGLTLSNASASDRGMVAVGGDQNEGHILYLINGRPVREVLQGGSSADLLASFPVNILERVEVIKGPGSVLYGSDAVAGVINLITKKAVGKDFHLSTAAEPGGGIAESEEILFPAWRS
jgi:outer membrane receptor for ferrienterochelin and colicin